MELFSYNAKIDFMRIRQQTVLVAIVLMLLSLGLIVFKGINLALDFTGGTIVEVRLDGEMDVAKVRNAIEQAGLTGGSVQQFGPGEVAIRLPPLADETGGVGRISDQVAAALRAGDVEGTIVRSDSLGAQVGGELFIDGMFALLVVMLGILIYVAARFEWRFGVAAIAGQFHDVLVCVGFVVLLGIEFDLTVLAALLTVLGYSINDKIVVFDRIRELFRSARKDAPIDILNASINSTLARTLITSITTIINLVVLIFLGGPALESFATVLLFGVIIGTLSSIYFASPILLLLGVSKRDLLVSKEEDPRLAARP